MKLCTLPTNAATALNFTNIMHGLIKCGEQDGRSSSLTAPNGPAQQAVIRSAVAAAGLLPADIGGLEMHGTGTALGDPIEMGAAVTALPGSKLPLRFTAAKSIVGHAEPAAGTSLRSAHTDLTLPQPGAMTQQL